MADAAAALAVQGFVLLPTVCSRAECARIAAQTELLAMSNAGRRDLLAQSWCRDLARQLGRRLVSAGVLTDGAWAVQCTYFEKTLATNWLVAAHQDLSVPLADRASAPGWRGWARKEGMWFAQPPVPMLERLLAARLHLDPCGEHDGPLRVVPASHQRGVVSPEEAVRRRGADVACMADVGDVLLMRPLALHASSRASGDSRRRVLHFLWAPPSPGDGLDWPVNAVPLPRAGKEA
ncbi:MAG: phytanoyl-CoA dioxygenase family protein [Pseudomonadota bacterium]|nr:phytanoyl-CoA dioxygenase family protein [Pseudomonadota bacterium]